MSLHRTSYIVTIWAELSEPNQPLWRGYLEMPNGARKYFDSLVDLNRLIRESSGWVESSDKLQEENQHSVIGD